MKILKWYTGQKKSNANTRFCFDCDNEYNPPRRGLPWLYCPFCGKKTFGFDDESYERFDKEISIRLPPFGTPPGKQPKTLIWGVIMARRKRYIKGRVYITNDKVLVGGKGKKRRVVSMGNDKQNMAVRRILSLYDKNGKKKERLIPIEKYSDIPDFSGVEDKTFRETVSGNPINEKYLFKTKTRLNKWDMSKICRGKNKHKNKG